VEFTVRHPWRAAAARRPCEEGPAGFIAVRKAVGGGFLAHQGNQVGVWVMAWPRYGAKGRRRRAACTPARGWLGGAAPVRRHCGPWVRGTWRQGSRQERRFHGAWTGGSSAASAFGPEGVGRGERARRGATRRRAGRRSGSKPF
jgi:hypothetical protein